MQLEVSVGRQEEATWRFAKRPLQGTGYPQALGKSITRISYTCTRMEVFRVYTRVKIQTGKFEAFEARIPEVVQIVKNSEPETVQFEGFAHAETREIVWLMSYTGNHGFDLHLANTALDKIRGEIMPMQEEVRHMFFLGAPTETAVAGMASFGMATNTLQPWPGTDNLGGERGADNIQIVAILETNNMDAIRTISARFEAAAAGQPGFLFHRSYQLDDNRVVSYGEWADTPALRNWLTGFGEKFGAAYMPHTTHLEMIGCGNLSSEAKDLLAGWNAAEFKKVAGFTRYQAEAK